MAEDLANRLIRIFTRDAAGRRPVHGERRKFQEDPYWRDLILFHEYFHGETGEGLGASHQTGWTGLVASLIDEWRRPGRGLGYQLIVAHPHAILRPSPAATVNLDVDYGAGRDDTMHAANTLRPTCASCV